MCRRVRSIKLRGHHHAAAHRHDVQVILLTGSIVGYAYAMEFFIAWYGGNPYEQFTFITARSVHYWLGLVGWTMMFCNVIAPQFFWFKRFRRNIYVVVFIVSIFVNVGMWFERFVIIVTSLAPRLPAVALGYFSPTWVDIWTFIGTFGIFFRSSCVHPLPADDRDVGSEGRHAASRSASSATPRHHPVAAGEKERHENPVRTQSLRRWCRVSELPRRSMMRPRSVRDAGFKRWDVHSPFPVHGMDEAMGLGKSWLSASVLIGGITGLLTAVTLEFGPSLAHLSARSCTGSPTIWRTVPAFFPIMFELTVLFSAFTAFFALLIMNGLPRGITRSSTGNVSSASQMTDSFSLSRHAIRASPKSKRASFWSAVAANT